MIPPQSDSTSKWFHFKVIPHQSDSTSKWFYLKVIPPQNDSTAKWFHLKVIPPQSDFTSKWFLPQSDFYLKLIPTSKWFNLKAIPPQSDLTSKWFHLKVIPPQSDSYLKLIPTSKWFHLKGIPPQSDSTSSNSPSKQFHLKVLLTWEWFLPQSASRGRDDLRFLDIVGLFCSWLNHIHITVNMCLIIVFPNLYITIHTGRFGVKKIRTTKYYILLYKL